MEREGRPEQYADQLFAHSQVQKEDRREQIVQKKSPRGARERQSAKAEASDAADGGARRGEIAADQQPGNERRSDDEREPGGRLNGGRE